MWLQGLLSIAREAPPKSTLKNQLQNGSQVLLAGLLMLHFFGEKV